jgi:hypothetical protein
MYYTCPQGYVSSYGSISNSGTQRRLSERLQDLVNNPNMDVSTARTLINKYLGQIPDPNRFSHTPATKEVLLAVTHALRAADSYLANDQQMKTGTSSTYVSSLSFGAATSLLLAAATVATVLPDLLAF